MKKKIVYTKEILPALSNAGNNSKRLRDDKLIGQSSIQKIRNNEVVSIKNLETICNLLNCDISDVIQCVDVED